MSGQRQTSRSALSALPLELVFQIEQQLPIESRISLALTHKPFFRALCPTGKFPDAEPPNLQDLLLGLERDSQGLCLCFHCFRLHSYDPDHPLGWRGQVRHTCRSWQSRTSCCRAFHRARSSHDRHQWIPNHKHLGQTYSFVELHLVMNRHLYGVGFRLSTLERHFAFGRWLNLNEIHEAGPHFPLENHPMGKKQQTRAAHKTALARLLRTDNDENVYQTAGNTIDTRSRTIQKKKWLSHPKSSRIPLELTAPWSFEHSTKAKIIDDELYLSHHHHVRGPLVSTQGLRKLLNHIDLPICLHLACRGDVRHMPLMPLHIPDVADLDRDMTDGGPSIGSCPFCFTDYELMIKKHRIDQSWDLSLATFHRIGSCRHPFEKSWSFLCKEPASLGKPEPFCERQPGEVWEKYHGGSADSNAQGSSTREPRWVTCESMRGGGRRRRSVYEEQSLEKSNEQHHLAHDQNSDFVFEDDDIWMGIQQHPFF